MRAPNLKNRIWRRVSRVCAILMLVIMTFACQQREAYFHFEELKNANWGKYDTLYFDIDSIKGNTPYAIYVEVTNNVNYPYQNLWLFAQDNFTDSIFHEHKIECRLADESGRWLGAGFGSLYQSSFVYETKAVFSNNRNDYRMKIVHGMRDETLLGIERIGVKIEKIE